MLALFYIAQTDVVSVFVEQGTDVPDVCVMDNQMFVG